MNMLLGLFLTNLTHQRLLYLQILAYISNVVTPLTTVLQNLHHISYLYRKLCQDHILLVVWGRILLCAWEQHIHNHPSTLQYPSKYRWFNKYSTNCDQLTCTPWLRSLPSRGPSPDAVKHSLILQENRDIWRRLHPFSYHVWHNGTHLFCCDTLQINCDIMQPYMLPHPLHAGGGLLWMQSAFLCSLPSFTAISRSSVIGCCCFSWYGLSHSFTAGFYFESGHLHF